MLRAHGDIPIQLAETSKHIRSSPWVSIPGRRSADTYTRPQDRRWATCTATHYPSHSDPKQFGATSLARSRLRPGAGNTVNDFSVAGSLYSLSRVPLSLNTTGLYTVGALRAVHRIALLRALPHLQWGEHLTVILVASQKRTNCI